jgi:hypothetical protein
MTVGRALALFALLLAAPAAACPGDCDDDGAVGVAELILGVRIGLGDAAVDACSAADGDRTRGIGELVVAVRAPRAGDCPPLSPDEPKYPTGDSPRSHCGRRATATTVRTSSREPWLATSRCC